MRIELFRGDIPLPGGGGVDGVIHCLAWPESPEACRAPGGFETHEAKVMPGFDAIARYIYHPVGPVLRRHGGFAPVPRRVLRAGGSAYGLEAA